MSTPLNVLMVEDSEDDALLVTEGLRDGGYDLNIERVETRETMEEALDRREWDVILADYHLPRFSGLDALSVVQQRKLDIPFIIVSGQISEDTAVKAMRAGAHDYVLKQNLIRLVPAIERELREADIRRERRLTEEALRQNQRIFQSVIDASNAAIYLKDPRGRFMLVNNASARFMGTSKEEAIGETDYDFLPKEAADLYHRNDVEVMESGIPREYEESITREGTIRTFISAKFPVYDSSGNVYGIGGVSTEITQFKQIEEALDAERRRLRAILEALPVGVFMADSNGRVLGHNKQVEAIWGAGAPQPNTVEEYGAYKGRWAGTGEPLTGKDWALAKAVLRGETTVGELIEIERFDGKRATILGSAAPVLNAEGRIIGAVATVQDVTELEMLRAALENALEDARRESERAHALESVAEAGIATTDLQELMDTLVKRMAEILSSHSCTIWMLDEETNEFVARAECGEPGRIGSRLGTDKGIPHILSTEQRPVYTSDAERDPLVMNHVLKEQKVKALLSVPLITRDRVVGMARVDSIEPREFTREETGLLEAMAARAAQAIDNTMLYDELTRSRNDLAEALDRERHFSLLLQRALLPSEPAIGAGYEVAAEYVPVYVSREIGGDFYDVFMVGDRRAGVLIGDVSGKGLEAAAMAATTRSTIHAFVHETSSAAEALMRANSVLYPRQSEFDAFVTVFLAMIDTRNGDITYASAGHPPALICRSNGSTEYLELGQTPLALLDKQVYREHHVSFGQGDKLILYTDGISEAHHDSELLDTTGIQRTVARYSDMPASELAHTLLATATDWARGKLSDDAAVVVIERGRQPGQ